MNARERWKGFLVGLAMTGMTVFTAAAPQSARSLCAGACSQCYACGLTALPLVLWLAAKRWRPIATVRELFGGVASGRPVPPGQRDLTQIPSRGIAPRRAGACGPWFRA